MKILLMNQFFWPDGAATSQLLTDLARDLAADGHQVEVIAGGTYAATAAETAPPVTIHRIAARRFSRGTMGRLVSYASFYAGAAWRAFTMPKFDVVLTLTTPPLLSVIGGLLHRLRGTRFYIWEMDVYPDVAVDLGHLRRNSLLHKAIGWLADWSRQQANGVVALGECMRDRLIARGVSPEKIIVIHNWADSRQIQVRPENRDRTSLEIVYSGNLGLAHESDTIIAAIAHLRDDPRFHFTFIGGGSRREQLARFVTESEISSVTLRPYVPRVDLTDTLGSGDIGLVTQRDDCCGSVVPSKVYGLMAAGRPILFIGPAFATPARIVREHACGWHIPVGDSLALIRLLQHLADRPEEIRAAGRNARQALETFYDRSIGTQRLTAVLVDGSLLSNKSKRRTAVTETTLTSVS